jgi:transcriptional regulator with XRE-family HTH domain
MEELSDKHKEFLAQIRALRKERKLTLVQCAEQLGVGQNTLTRLERGDRDITLPKLIAYLDILGADIEIKIR